MIVRAYEPRDAAALDTIAASSFPPGLDDFLVGMQLRAREQQWADAYGADGRLVAVDEGEVVGTLWLADREHDVRVVDVAVAEPLRRQGLGRALLEHAIAGGRDVSLSVFDGNAPMEALVRSLGFERLGGSPYVEWRRQLSSTSR